jgi:branched-chain amino acid transport system substrate-binding protein
MNWGFMKQRRLLAAGAAALIAAASLMGPAARAQPAPDASRVSDGVVKIGLILDMTGTYSELTGKGSAAAAQMAVEDFGGKVLGAPIEIVTADHQNNADRAAAIARDWFDSQHVDAVMEVSGSSEALIVQAIGGTRDKVVILNAPGATRLTNEACTATSVHYTNDTYATAHSLGRALVAGGSDTWFFVTVDYSFGYDLENETAAVVTANGGKVLGRARHPLDAPDLSAYLLQAQQSRAKVIGLANGGGDTANAIKQAAALKMTPGPQLIAGLSLRINGVHNLGLAATQGMMLTESFYWDQDDPSRAWSKRFFARTGKMPNALQAGVYSSTTHYLQAVASTGTDATEPVMKAMRAAPVNDFFAHNGHIRADGVMVHDMYLYRVKSPAESKYPWDYYRLVTTIPGNAAFQPPTESKCPLVKR